MSNTEMQAQKKLLWLIVLSVEELYGKELSQKQIAWVEKYFKNTKVHIDAFLERRALFNKLYYKAKKQRRFEQYDDDHYQYDSAITHDPYDID